MKREETIKSQKLFNNIIKNGNFIKNDYFVIYSSKNEDNKINYGIAISKKIGNAVTRNKIKRQTRAIIDRNRNLFKKSHNYIIMIRKSCVSKKFNTLEEALIDLLKK